MARSTRTYGHFCMLAKTLERVGERWTLLVVRDLASGPRRFTDLMDRLGGITPKTLSLRLRTLEEDGLVEVDRQPGRREVWYRLTPAGFDLVPALEELLLWGLRHAAQPPAPGEATHPEHLLLALRILLERTDVRMTPTHWLLHLTDDGSYVIAYDGDQWSVEAGAVSDPDIVITTTREAWARLLTTPPTMRAPDQHGVQIAGRRQAVSVFMKTIAIFPWGRPASDPSGSP